MGIKNHGDWVRYQPTNLPEGYPQNAMFARRVSDGMDWYDYVHAEGSFAVDTIKLTVHDHVVGAATLEPDRLFPAGATVLEIDGVNHIADPQAEYGRKIYDAHREVFREAPIPGPPPGMADLLRRLEVLEGKAP